MFSLCGLETTYPTLPWRLGSGGSVTSSSSSGALLHCCWGVDGSGHVRSSIPCWQNSRISLYRYHCHSFDRPGGNISGGSPIIVDKNTEVLSGGVAELLQCDHPWSAGGDEVMVGFHPWYLPEVLSHKCCPDMWTTSTMSCRQLTYTPVLLLQESEAPIWGKLRVSLQHEGHSDWVVQSHHHMPCKIQQEKNSIRLTSFYAPKQSYLQNHVVLILPRAVVSMQAQFMLSQCVVGKEVVQEAYHSVGSLLCVGCFID